MTLAVILFVSFFCASAASGGRVESVRGAVRSGSRDRERRTAARRRRIRPLRPKSTSSPTTQTPSAQKPAAAPHAPQEETTSRPIASQLLQQLPLLPPVRFNFIPGSVAGRLLPAGATPPPQPASAPTICPPRKVIVRQGGTSEPSIQLAGGAVGDQAAQQRQTATQMLGYTEANLKKIAGRPLTTNQQDMVNQIHQFMDQSKTAVAAGDLERGRTLAWKAQLLSEELVSPQK